MEPRIGVIDAVAEYHRRNKHDAVDVILWRTSLVGKVIIAIAAVLSLHSQEFFLIMSGFFALLFMFMPAIITRTWNVYFPLEIEVAVTFFILVHLIFGELSDYYTTLWFDFALHWTGGLILGLLGFLMIYAFISLNKVHARTSAVLLFTVAFAMGMAATWEIFEFAMDQLFGFNMQKSGIVDTMWDLIAAMIGALIVGLLGYRYLTLPEKRRGIIHRMVKKIHDNALRMRTR